MWVLLGFEGLRLTYIVELRKNSQCTTQLDYEIQLNVQKMLKSEFFQYYNIIILIGAHNLFVFHISFLFHTSNISIVMEKQNNNGKGCLLDVHR